jgi:hypothetical protein
MITIFCDFRPFSAKNKAFFLKTQFTIIFCKNWQYLVKNANFSPNFCGKILKKTLHWSLDVQMIREKESESKAESAHQACLFT